MADSDKSGVKELTAADGDDDNFINECIPEAEKGSIEHQLFLAKNYLKRAKNGIKPEENGAMAVYWLIKASRKANAEATGILEECLLDNIGITDQNREDVLWCVETSELEKSVRSAARGLFQTIASQTEATSEISRELFMKSIDKVAATKAEISLLKNAGKIKSKEPLSEEEFVNRVLKRMKSGGASSNVEHENEKESFQKAGLYVKLRRYPTRTVAMLVDGTLETASKQGMRWLMTLIPTSQIHMLLVFFLYSLLSLNIITTVVPLFIFYMAFLTMVVCSLQMLYGRKKLEDVRAWTKMLKRFNSAVDNESAESSFTWNSLQPYWMFFVALLFCVIGFACARHDWIPCSEFNMVSTFFTIASFIALSDRYDHLVLISIVLDVLASLQSVFEGFPPIPIVSHILQAITGPLIVFEVLPGINLNVGIPSLAYMIIPLLFIRMAMQRSWQGTYRVLVPHLVCFFWWQCAIMFFNHATWLGLIRGSVGWCLFIILLPLWGIVFVVYSIVYLSQVLSVAIVMKVVATFILLTIPGLVYMIGMWKPTEMIRRVGAGKRRIVKRVFLALLSVFSVIPLMYLYVPAEVETVGSLMTWDQYKTFCSHPAWQETNMANAQIRCAHLKHVKVDWSGKVKMVRITKIENQIEALFDFLPYSLASWLQCVYGEEYPKCNATEQDPKELELCKMYESHHRKCHTRNLDYYHFEVWVTMTIEEGVTQDVILKARDHFRDAILLLQEGHDISFRARLKSDMGGLRPELILKHLDCPTCQAVIPDLDSFEESSVFSAIGQAASAVLNFFTAPVIVFHL